MVESFSLMGTRILVFILALLAVTAVFAGWFHVWCATTQRRALRVVAPQRSNPRSHAFCTLGVRRLLVSAEMDARAAAAASLLWLSHRGGAWSRTKRHRTQVDAGRVVG